VSIWTSRSSRPTTPDLPRLLGYHPRVEWRVILEGAEADLRELADQTSGAVLRVSRDEAEYRLDSPEFDALLHAADVHNKAAELVRLLNSARTLDRLGAPVTVKDIYSVAPGGGRVHTIVLNAELAPRGTVSFPGAPAIPEVPWVRRAINRLSDPNVRLALEYLGEGTWYGLYKAVEAVEAACGGEARLSGKRWIPADELKLLKWTANSGAGPQTRHAEGTFEAPKYPMTFQDAKQNVVILICHLIGATDEGTIS
jgi:hypothetical protein